ncbi:hypothetical protein HZA42_03450 [Candidatus Peregrinibacteria bacterium]|nr:hypothetical protein [Candidatus Peregrinibacteria bacterium]
MKYALVLGRTNKISVAELGSFFDAGMDAPLGRSNPVGRPRLGTASSLSLTEPRLGLMEVAKSGAVAYAENLPAPPQTFLNKLGGCVEILEIFEKGIAIGAVESLILKYLIKACEGQKGKLLFAVNIVPEGKSSSLLKYLLPKLKKALKEVGVSANYMNNDLKNVSAVLAVKQNLVGMKTNISVIEEGEGRFSLGFSVAMQDFEAYSKRDYGKPFRDARVGMLPPKLAQMMINLATHERSECAFTTRHASMAGQPGAQRKPGLNWPQQPTLVFDPFCGTGTILMEAMLLGNSVVGSDADARMATGARTNLEWLRKNFKIAEGVTSEVSTKDACHCERLQGAKRSISVVTEPHLGPPLSTFPARAFIEQVMNELSKLYLDFFKNLAKWLPTGSPVVFLFPVWHNGNKEKIHISALLIDKIEAFGYIKTTFVPLKETSLFYDRPGQVVGREIVRFTKK